MVTDYKSRKNEVLAACGQVEKLVTDIHTYAGEASIPDPTSNLDTLLADIRSKAKKVEADQFNIMVAGEAKSGKSTFINAYLGVELMPMDVKQCTSSIVEIKYGETFSVRATYADGTVKEISSEEEARKFLRENAALNDKYRSIPVPTINYEILIKCGGGAAQKKNGKIDKRAEIKNWIESPEVQDANIHHLPDYNKKIWEYIQENQDNWRKIVTKIEVMYPFGEDMKGIHLIDSPGICARGGVANITSDYIENADAIIFLKPISGQALESSQFNKFMQNTSVSRNKNTLFLVLTRAADLTKADLRSQEEEAYRQFRNLDQDHILIVDSKAELYSKKFEQTNNIRYEMQKLNQTGTLDSFVMAAYFDTMGDDKAFLDKLHEIARFEQIYNSLNTFGRKSNYILLDALLSSINRLYTKLLAVMNEQSELFRLKADDPIKLARQIADLKFELDNLLNKISWGVDKVSHKFTGYNGIIRTDVDESAKDFLEKVNKIDPDADDAFDQLERLSFEKADQFKFLAEKLQRDIVAGFNKVIALNNKDSISFETSNIDDIFRQCIKNAKYKAYKTEPYETGIFFTRTYTACVRRKYFNIMKSSIEDYLNKIKDALIHTLIFFVEYVRTKYMDELTKNAYDERNKLDAIMEAQRETVSIAKKIDDWAKVISLEKDNIDKIKEGIAKCINPGSKI